MASQNHKDFSAKLLEIDWFLEKYVDIFEAAKNSLTKPQNLIQKEQESSVNSILSTDSEEDSINYTKKNEAKTSLNFNESTPQVFIKYPMVYMSYSTSVAQEQSSYFEKQDHIISAKISYHVISELYSSQNQDISSLCHLKYIKEILSVDDNAKSKKKDNHKKSRDANIIAYASSLQDELRNVCKINHSLINTNDDSSISGSERSQKKSKLQKKISKPQFEIEEFDDIYVMSKELDRRNAIKKVKRD